MAYDVKHFLLTELSDEMEESWKGVSSYHFFSNFDLQNKMAQILNATGCREGWLQGEIYAYMRQYDPAFSLNKTVHLEDKSYIKVDFSGINPEEMVGEVKIYGTSGYQFKNLDGRGLKSAGSLFEEPTGDDGCKRRRLKIDQLGDVQYGLLKDYTRLKKFPPDKGERLLVLVVQKTGSLDRFGKLIQEIQLTEVRNERSVEYHGALIRIWSI